MLSTFLFLTTMYLSHAGYASFGTTNTHPLVICGDLTADYNALDVNGVFPDALAESKCVAIDVCAEKNHRDEAVPYDTWVHRSDPALYYDGEYPLTDGVVYNYHNIEYARVPAGVMLHACQPDFDRVRTHGVYECNDDTLVSIAGNCPGVGFDLQDCLMSTQYDAVSATQPADRGGTQMIRYAFLVGYRCYTAADTSVGVQLSSDTKPNQLVPCQPVEHGTLTIQNGCEFVCDAGYTASGDACVPKCSETELTCPDGFKADSICLEMSEPRYTCSPCADVSGQETLPWSASVAGTCQYQDCTAGYYGSDGVCTPCPLNTFTDNPQAASCQPCAYGFHQDSTGQSSCVPCFSETLDTTGLCQDGEMLVRDIDAVTAYLQKLTTEQQAHLSVPAFCAQYHACLPCLPGYYEQARDCVTCPFATYQPNYKMTTCFDCSVGQNTTTTNCTAPEHCVCDPGFE
tara:strand:- start:2160 stop:3533 length:1374 start_codon:yes stop_codon:yes gene_type:complete